MFSSYFLHNFGNNCAFFNYISFAEDMKRKTNKQIFLPAYRKKGTKKG
jgi:hypothetical protein